MRPGNREGIATVEEAVRDAMTAVDPEQRSDGVTALFESFEDDERPATAASDLAGELRSTARGIDPDFLDPRVWAAAAAAFWLATNPSHAEQPEHAIEEGVRLFFGDEVPESVRDWLENEDPRRSA